MGWTDIINIYVKICDILRGIMYNQIVPQKRHRMDERYFYYENYEKKSKWNRDSSFFRERSSKTLCCKNINR